MYLHINLRVFGMSMEKDLLKPLNNIERKLNT